LGAKGAKIAAEKPNRGPRGSEIIKSANISANMTLKPKDGQMLKTNWFKYFIKKLGTT
jgi:hypothetical protein